MVGQRAAHDMAVAIAQPFRGVVHPELSVDQRLFGDEARQSIAAREVADARRTSAANLANARSASTPARASGAASSAVRAWI